MSNTGYGKQGNIVPAGDCVGNVLRKEYVQPSPEQIDAITKQRRTRDHKHHPWGFNAQKAKRG